MAGGGSGEVEGGEAWGKRKKTSVGIHVDVCIHNKLIVLDFP